MFEVTPEVCAVLGVTPEQVRAMTLGQFSDLVHSKGGTVRVGPFTPHDEPELCGLTIKMEHEVDASPQQAAG